MQEITSLGLVHTLSCEACPWPPENRWRWA